MKGKLEEAEKGERVLLQEGEPNWHQQLVE
jgi:hypothetical protein